MDSSLFSEQFQSDKDLVDADHKKHLSDLRSSISTKAVLVYRKPLVYPAEGTPAQVQAGIERICEKFFNGAQIPREVLITGIHWITTAFEEIVSEGELLVMKSTKGLKPLFTLSTLGKHDYYLVGTARYQVEVTKLVKKSHRGQKVLNRDKSRIAVTWSAVIEVRRSNSTESDQQNSDSFLMTQSHSSAMQQSGQSPYPSTDHLKGLPPTGYTPLNSGYLSLPSRPLPKIPSKEKYSDNDHTYVQVDS